VNTQDLVDRLAGHKTLGGVPREELEWLAAHGTLRHLAEGEILSHKGATVANLHVILKGHVAIFVDRGAGKHRVMEWRGGDVTGVLPYSRVGNPPGDTLAQEPTEVLVVPRADLDAMILACREITTILVHKMLDRSKTFTSSELHDEKMVSLGKLSAGLAHELNNPAAAIERSAALLEARLEEAERSTRALGASNLTDAQLAAIDGLRSACLKPQVQGVLSPIQQAEREDSIADWLEAHQADPALAGALAETSVTIGALDKIAEAVQGPSLLAVLRWTAAGWSVRGIASEIREAAQRISGLVAAIKGFTHMDQATVAEPVDLATNLSNTVAVLNAKARAKSAAVTIDVEPGLPSVRGFAGELNQIWANLIDNALDAVPDQGRVDVSAKRDPQGVVVRVVDNGPGIPPEFRKRLFEPFFTTKPVGKGTGLGLDIVRRLILHNDAQIEFDSKPGRTEFRVVLPVAEGDGAGAAT
jgi:signal transduction histidine kinase